MGSSQVYIGFQKHINRHLREMWMASLRLELFDIRLISPWQPPTWFPDFSFSRERSFVCHSETPMSATKYETPNKNKSHLQTLTHRPLPSLDISASNNQKVIEKMTYNMLRRTKSSSLLPIVRYFYPEPEIRDLDIGTPRTAMMDVRVGSRTPPPHYEQLYQAMQLDHHENIEEERVRKKYACHGTPLLVYIPMRFEISCFGVGGGFVCVGKSRSWIFKGSIR
jgi:hypothetical protein